VIVDIEPGLLVGAESESDRQVITAVWLSATGEDATFDRHALPLSGLDAVSAATVLRDLEGAVQ
jgi:hypothetical protein